MNKEIEKHFLELIDENKGCINRLCSVYTKNLDDRKDLIQEVYYQLWKSLPNFRKESKASTWVYRVCLNVCIRSCYTQKKVKVVPFLSMEIKETSNEELYDKDLRDKLHACISKLKGVDKSIMLLFLEDLAYKEIAKIVGISENYVAVKIKRIKTILLNCLNN